jgi:hypothetical protein
MVGTVLPRWGGDIYMLYLLFADLKKNLVLMFVLSNYFINTDYILFCSICYCTE